MYFSNLLDIVLHRSLHTPTERAYCFLEKGEIEKNYLTYKQLELQVKTIGSELQHLTKAGDRILLLYPPGLEFISAFLGCLYAGTIAVPTYPPRPDRSLFRVNAIAKSCEPKLILTTQSFRNYLQTRFKESSELSNLEILATDEIQETTLAWEPTKVNPNDLTFLQYTSGSTGDPKGVKNSHTNVLHNLALLQAAFQIPEHTRGVFWMPLGHNSGLIGAVLYPLYAGFTSIQMSPLDFLQNPSRWLRAISEYQATVSFAPNFAYELACLKITPEQRCDLDLTSWELAINGSETIRAETLEKFVANFAPYGFRREAFNCCYGMAENVVCISANAKLQPPAILNLSKTELAQNRVLVLNEKTLDTREIVGCGQNWLGQKIIIVNPETLTECGENEVGEIWVSSPSVAQGYWNQPQATINTFGGSLADADAQENTFLRTGDLGFLLNGEVFITGRLKELVIIRGRNYYPQDIEAIVEKSHPELAIGSGAAFSIALDTEENLAIAQEIKDSNLDPVNFDEVIQAIRQTIAQNYDLQVYAILLLKQGTIPKTDSGKVQRQVCQMNFLTGNLQVIAQWQQTTQSSENYLEDKLNIPPILEDTKTIQTWLIQKIAQQLQVSPETINIKSPLTKYGLDSVQVVNISGDLEAWLGRNISPTLLWDYPTIEQISLYLTGELESKPPEIIDLQKEIVLNSRISAGSNPVYSINSPNSILLTGSTGFLGAFLLEELLKQSQANVYCLIRAENVKAGQGKIKSKLESYGIWQDRFSHRIIPVLGDISKPKLGLNEREFQQLSDEIDVIYHSAALLNYVYPYSKFKPINIFGTQEILRLASSSKLKLVHYISTVAVFESSAYFQKTVTESNPLNYSEEIYLGYSQSKWVAEKIVMLARDRGIPICIYRPPFISGHTQTGVWNTDDIICRLIKGCIQMGSTPSLDFKLDLSPVDYVSKAIVYLSRQQESLGKAFHLNNPHCIDWNSLFKAVGSLGYKIEKISYKDWQIKLKNITESQRNPLYPLLPFFLKSWSSEGLTVPELYEETRRPKIDCKQTLEILSKGNLFPTPIEDLLTVYLSYLISSGFLENP